jgi:hypothetical protein
MADVSRTRRSTSSRTTVVSSGELAGREVVPNTVDVWFGTAMSPFEGSLSLLIT